MHLQILKMFDAELFCDMSLIFNEVKLAIKIAYVSLDYSVVGLSALVITHFSLK
jgi:hypothetical protein